MRTTAITLFLFTPFINALAQQGSNDSIHVGNMIIVTQKNKSTTAEKKEVDYKSDTSFPDKKTDTIRIGNIIIVSNGQNETADYNKNENESSNRKKNKSPNISTNWIILDIGFNNYIDKTNYTNSGNYLYNRAGAAPIGANDFDLSAGKSINVNIWLFMQKLNLIKHHINLKYGLGIELNNYRYKSDISYLQKNPFTTGVTPAPVIFRDSVSFSKNKLAADYFTVPCMLNYTSQPNRKNKGFNISLGISAGYLYSQRNKQVSDTRGKKTLSGGIGIKQFKIAYVGEIGLGPIRLYGSYSPTSFYKEQLDIRPYSLGIRFSNW